MPTETELRKHRCCFTGHRPEKLNVPETTIKAVLEQSIRAAIADGFTVFISGMSRGVDIWAAEIVLWLRAGGRPVRLICASPYRGFEAGWNADWQKRYRDILQAADLVRFLCPCYRRGCFQTRNEWMVDRSSRVIAVYSGESGGTRNTLAYAAAHGVPTVTIKG